MMIAYLVVVGLAALFWLGRVFSPSSRMAPRFTYDEGTDPAALSGIVRGDRTPRVYAGDPTNEGEKGGEWPTVTVVVPGRNEGRTLLATLDSLCAMDYPHYRVIFIDDQSTDDTPRICRQLELKYPHLQVIHNTQNPPPGWVGKSWAIHQAQPETITTDYLLFTDADLHFHRLCLKQMIRLARHRQSDLLSLLPMVHCYTLGEKLGLMAGLQLIALACPLRKSNDPRHPQALVAGGFMLFKRTAYQAVGGHEAVRRQIIEDMAFGALMKKRQRSVYTVGTTDLLTGRMYEGWRDTFHGLKKNAYAGANYNPLIAVGFTLGTLLLAVLLPVYVLVGIFLWITQPSLLTFAALIGSVLAWSAMLVTARRANRLLRFSHALAWLAPLAAGFYLSIFLSSVIEHYRGGNKWSGRSYEREEVEALSQ